MGIGTMLGKLFGGSGSGEAGAGGDGASDADAVEHDGYTIVPAPIKEGGQYRTAGRILRTVDGEERQARFIRADNHADRQAAIDHSIGKARQIIAEQGAGLFECENV